MNLLSLKRAGRYKLAALIVRDSCESHLFRKPFRILRNESDTNGEVTQLRHALRFGHIRSQIVAILPVARVVSRATFCANLKQTGARRLLNSVGTAAGAGRSALSLFELEGQHVEQAIDAICHRFEQGLLFERRDIQVKAQEVD